MHHEPAMLMCSIRERMLVTSQKTVHIVVLHTLPGSEKPALAAAPTGELMSAYELVGRVFGTSVWACMNPFPCYRAH